MITVKSQRWRGSKDLISWTAFGAETTAVVSDPVGPKTLLCMRNVGASPILFTIEPNNSGIVKPFEGLDYSFISEGVYEFPPPSFDQQQRYRDLGDIDNSARLYSIDAGEDHYSSLWDFMDGVVPASISTSVGADSEIAIVNLPIHANMFAVEKYQSLLEKRMPHV